MSKPESDLFVLHSIPKQVVQDRDQFPETYQLLSSAVGNTFRARGTDDCGMIEFWIDDEGTNSSDACADSIWVEPEFLTPVAKEESQPP